MITQCECKLIEPVTIKTKGDINRDGFAGSKVNTWCRRKAEKRY